MITNPLRQNSFRDGRSTRNPARIANSAEHQAALAFRLTPRDRWIIRMLHEHRVLTTHQITMMVFPSPRSGRGRLRELYLWSVLDRFQPFTPIGTAPMHYVLGPAGAVVLANEHGQDLKAFGYRRDRVLGIAHSWRLAHTIGVNDWFVALTNCVRHDPAAKLTAWWSENRCEKHFGDLVRPDAYGRWTKENRNIEFFLEYDLASEKLATVANKLSRYAALASTTSLITPILFWFPTARRETAARKALHEVWVNLDEPASVPVATAAAEHLNTSQPHPSPADDVWLPLDVPDRVPRCELHEILDAWPHIPAISSLVKETNTPFVSAAISPAIEPLAPMNP